MTTGFDEIVGEFMSLNLSGLLSLTVTTKPALEAGWHKVLLDAMDAMDAQLQCG
jgi:hypothetical protein